MSVSSALCIVIFAGVITCVSQTNRGSINAYFAGPNPSPNAPIAFGQLSRVTGFRMQPFYNEDVNLAKRFSFTETVSLELRADAFNLVNRHVFGQPGNLNPAPNITTTNFGFLGAQ